uniref:Uncharacterized protein n=1 Tax=Arundo donax TaxID=35708 RepID=A0A0A9GGL9_ARUDO
MMVPNHMPGVSGFKKIHVLLFMISLTGTTIATLILCMAE